MVSSAVASVDAWIQQAEQVLDEVREQGLSLSTIRENSTTSLDAPHEPIEKATSPPPVRYYSRPKANATNAELREWADGFVSRILDT